MKIYSLLKDREQSFFQKSDHGFDFVIVGSGAGGGLSAFLLSQYGHKVLLLEHGPFVKTADLSQDEAKAYPLLYQEAAARKTSDGAITILQGRSLGGSTTVNWTSSFRTPRTTLKFWQDEFGLKDLREDSLAPYFEVCEKLLNIKPWDISPNENNEVLARGLKRAGLKAELISRNVLDCQNLGLCGLGCPTGAKQSSLQALLRKAPNVTIVTDAFAHSFSLSEKKKVKELTLYPRGKKSGQWRIPIKELIVSGGAINSAALLLRSKSPDPYKNLGKRTFLHPVVLTGAHFKESIDPYYGAPQVIYSDAFMSEDPRELGFKIEVPPIHPLLLASVLPFGSDQHRELMSLISKTNAMIALQRDGFHPESQGGEVRVDGQGRVHLDYDTSEYMQRGFRKALKVMGRLQFAAGAKEVLAIHRHAKKCQNLSDFEKEVENLSMQAHDLTVVSAHVMGGCAMSLKPEDGVVREDGSHHHLENLSVFDGSLFPTSIGTNPMLSVYALVHKLCEEKFGKG